LPHTARRRAVGATDRPASILTRIGGVVSSPILRTVNRAHLCRFGVIEHTASISDKRIYLGQTMPRQTYIAKPGEIKTVWRHVDAEGKTLGRLATEVATVLMGKHRPEYTPGVLSGDAVIVTNASKVVLSGRKLDQKTRRRWSGYPGGLKIRSYRQEIDSNPARLVSEAILRMVPKGRYGRSLHARLRVFAGATHTHASQEPIAFDSASARHEMPAQKPAATQKAARPRSAPRRANTRAAS
jgi:large subunit ribosomal protein L13